MFGHGGQRVSEFTRVTQHAECTRDEIREARPVPPLQEIETGEKAGLSAHHTFLKEFSFHSGGGLNRMAKRINCTTFHLHYCTLAEAPRSTANRWRFHATVGIRWHKKCTKRLLQWVHLQCCAIIPLLFLYLTDVHTCNYE